MADAPLTDLTTDEIDGIEELLLTGTAFTGRIIRSMIAEIRRHRTAQRGEWRSMDSAPKDGTLVDLWCVAPGLVAPDAGRTTDCWFADGQWWRYDDQWGGDQCRTAVHNVTHWMPLPTPPALSDTDKLSNGK